MLSMKNIVLTSGVIDIADCIAWASASAACGGVNVFIGTVRNATRGRAVVRLEFEAYERMALKQMERIAADIHCKWPVERVLIHHRTGVLSVGDVPVVIAVASAHRDVAFEACKYAIDTLKESVPIWKKEVFEDGEIWVAAHP